MEKERYQPRGKLVRGRSTDFSPYPTSTTAVKSCVSTARLVRDVAGSYIAISDTGAVQSQDERDVYQVVQ